MKPVKVLPIKFRGQIGFRCSACGHWTFIDVAAQLSDQPGNGSSQALGKLPVNQRDHSESQGALSNS
jgi:hypothetical protein